MKQEVNQKKDRMCDIKITNQEEAIANPAVVITKTKDAGAKKKGIGKAKDKLINLI